jgi:EAL domain-containing protein (putative c-di-GMP-specific phosphodiesterase class I)
MTSAWSVEKVGIPSAAHWLEAQVIGRDELAVAELAWRAMRDDRIEFAFQAVCSATDSRVVLYHECLARLVDDGGQEISPAEFIPALKAAGLTRMFDRRIVGRVIALLEKHPDVTLGVNISALSVSGDELWAPIQILLSSRPDLACRLIVEITETESVDPVAASGFVRRLRQSGCRVAIDDFGAGYSFSTAKAIVRADIVKIDGSWIAKVAQGKCSSADFGGLVSLARGFASCVVVEGIETEADLKLVRCVEAEWVQGYWFGKPSRSALPLLANPTGCGRIAARN